jgi:hypothetical protein
VLFGIAVEVDDVSDNEWLEEFTQYFFDVVRCKLDFINMPIVGTLERELVDKIA